MVFGGITSMSEQSKVSEFFLLINYKNNDSSFICKIKEIPCWLLG